MRKILILLIISFFSVYQGYSQYCNNGGTTSTIDSNVEQVDITGENTTLISHAGCPGVAGIEDLTAQSVELAADSTYTLSVTFGTCGGVYSGVGEAWIDFNGNQVFDASESIGQSSGSPGTAPWDAPVDFTFTVPTNALNGTWVLRVIQWEGGVNPLDPCGNPYYGSVMDFGVVITGGSNCPAPSTLLASNITATTAELSWVTGGAANWNVEWGTQGFA